MIDEIWVTIGQKDGRQWICSASQVRPADPEPLSPRFAGIEHRVVRYVPADEEVTK